MQLVVTHLSKTWDGACLAGIDVEDDMFVRLKDADGNFPTLLDLTIGRRRIELGDRIAFDEVDLAVDDVHHENVGFEDGTLTVVHPQDLTTLDRMLERHVADGIDEGFAGTPLQRERGRACRIEDPGCSLCLLEPDELVAVDVRNSGAKITWCIGGREILSPLDDLSFYNEDGLDLAAVRQLRRSIGGAPGLVFACSISEWFEKNPGYWMIIAGIHH